MLFPIPRAQLAAQRTLLGRLVCRRRACRLRLGDAVGVDEVERGLVDAGVLADEQQPGVEPQLGEDAGDLLDLGGDDGGSIGHGGALSGLTRVRCRLDHLFDRRGHRDLDQGVAADLDPD